MNNFDERMWYGSLCNNNEVERIMSPSNGRDILLKERADIINDNVRLYRVYLHKQRAINDLRKWSFERTFNSSHYEIFLNHLEKDASKECKKMTYGDMYCKNVNAYAYNNPNWGKFVCLNVGMRFFMNFMNLALADWKKT